MRLAAVLRESRGGRRLVSIGMHRDIDTAARVDVVTVVPELDPQTLWIRLRS
jgi:phosphosulfolactate phosphohydrolase-like enzyme